MKQVTLVGFGPGCPGLLTVAGLQALQTADVVLGAARLLEALPEGCIAQRLEAVREKDIIALLETTGGWQEACVVLSGDLGLFSGAKGLYSGLQGYTVKAIPGISSAQYFAAKLRRPWQGWRFISAHGLACDIAAEAAVGGELFLVTGGKNSVGSLCRALCDAGLQGARVAVGQRLGYPDESIEQGTAAQFAGKAFDALSVLLVAAAPRKKAWEWANTGVPDESFTRGAVPMTKQEVRAAALAKLRVAAGDVVYDIGAGTGAVAVEAALLARRGQVYAIERNPGAVDLIEKNARDFGLANLHVVQGTAPVALCGLPAPQAVFVGGSGGSLGSILEAVHAASPAARVCVACITLETLSEAWRLLAGEGYTGFEVSQIAVSRADTVGGYHMMKAQNPVFLVSAQGVEP